MWRIVTRCPTMGCPARRHLSAAASAAQSRPPLRVGVVLSGCGVYDGAEITESVSATVHLSRHGAQIQFFAPSVKFPAVNHLNGQQTTETRDALIESARIARGEIKELSKLKASDFDAVVFPGGFGAAKNLSDFASAGSSMKVNEEVDRVLKEFRAQRRPIGLCCISPVLAACSLKAAVTVGHDSEEGGRWPYAGTAGAVKQMGATHVVRDLDQVHVDPDNLVVTAPAYMCAARPHEVFDSVGRMIDSVVKLATK